MVYVDPEEMKWSPYVKTWLARTSLRIDDDLKEYIEGLFHYSVEHGLRYVRKSTETPINQV